MTKVLLILDQTYPLYPKLFSLCPTSAMGCQLALTPIFKLRTFFRDAMIPHELVQPMLPDVPQHLSDRRRLELHLRRVFTHLREQPGGRVRRTAGPLLQPPLRQHPGRGHPRGSGNDPHRSGLLVCPGKQTTRSFSCYHLCMIWIKLTLKTPNIEPYNGA